MIYHVLNASKFQLTPNVIKSVLNYAVKTNTNGIEEHYFILRKLGKGTFLKKKKFDNTIYQKIFAEFKTSNYQLVNSDFKFIINLFRLSNKDKLILHGGVSLFGKGPLFWFLMFLLGKKYCKRTSIVCWGECIFALKNGKNKVKNSTLNFIQKTVFNRMNYII